MSTYLDPQSIDLLNGTKDDLKLIKKTIRDLSVWIDETKNLTGYSTSTISNILHLRSSKFKTIEFIGLLSEFKEMAKSGDALLLTQKRVKQIFIAYPMSYNDEFFRLNESIKTISALLESFYNASVFFAGRNMNSKEDFNQAPAVTNDDFQILHNSDKFIMIYPSKIVSSCLIEIGFALAEKKSCTVFYKNYNDLPFLLKGADQVLKLEYKDDEDLIKQIDKTKERLFK